MTNRRSLQTFDARLSRQTQFIPGHVGGRVASAQPVRRRATIGASAATPPVPPDEVWFQHSSYHTDGASTDVQLGSLAGASAAFAVIATAGMIQTQVPSGWTTLHWETLTENGKGEWGIIAIDNVVGTEGTLITSNDDPSVGYAGGQVSWCYLYGGDRSGSWGFTKQREYNDITIDLVVPTVTSGQPYYQCFWCQGVGGFTSYPGGMTLIGPGLMAGGYYPPRLDPLLPLRYETASLPGPIGGTVTINDQWVNPVWGSVAAWYG